MTEAHEPEQGEVLDYTGAMGDDQPPPPPPAPPPLPKDVPGREKGNLGLWFGDSKIRKKDGTPQRMLHGTNAAFTAFRVAPGGAYGPGIYFTDSVDLANDYTINTGAYAKSSESENAAPNVIPAYLRVVRPYVLHPQERAHPNLSGMVKHSGYDGIVVQTPGHPFFIVVVFDPRQVKSATGNMGDYDWRSEDMTMEGELDEALLRRVIRATVRAR